MSTIEGTIAVYLAHLHGKVIVIHGTSTREVAIARQLVEQLKILGIKDTECIPVSVRELGHAVRKAGHVVLVFNSLENLTKKLRHGEEFTAQVGRMRHNDLVLVCKGSQILSYSPLIHFMQFNFDEDVQCLAVKCLTVFGGNYCHSNCYRLLARGSGYCIEIFACMYCGQLKGGCNVLFNDVMKQ